MPYINSFSFPVLQQLLLLSHPHFPFDMLHITCGVYRLKLKVEKAALCYSFIYIGPFGKRTKGSIEARARVLREKNIWQNGRYTERERGRE